MPRRRKQRYSRADLEARLVELDAAILAPRSEMHHASCIASRDRVLLELASLDTIDASRAATRRTARTQRHDMTEPAGDGLDARVGRLQVNALRCALMVHGDDLTRAAASLGITERRARYIIAKYATRERPVTVQELLS